MPIKLGNMPNILGGNSMTPHPIQGGNRMPSQRRFQPLAFGLLVALCLAPGLSVIAAIPWLKQQPDDLVFLLSGIAAAVTIMASLVLAVLHDRRMDEWERS